MSTKAKILTIGLTPDIDALIADAIKDSELITLPMNMEKVLDDVVPPPQIILVGPPVEEVPLDQLVQPLKLQYSAAFIFLVCNKKENYERKNFISNGFTDTFLLPFDNTMFKTVLLESIAKANEGLLRVYRPVKIIDVEPGETLDFDTNVYLPANKKYVKVSNAGEQIDALRIEKLKKGKMTNVFVPIEQMKNFYQYSAKRLRTLNSENTLSATERKEKLTGAIRELIGGLFSEQTASFESGQAMLKDCGEIVKNYITQGAEGEWFLRILSVLGEKGDNYSHTGNVSTLATLFSMGLGVGKPEDLALAGLLHDIGIAELRPEVQTKALEEKKSAFLSQKRLGIPLIKF
jgi:hypothetical protein